MPDNFLDSFVQDVNQSGGGNSKPSGRGAKSFSDMKTGRRVRAHYDAAETTSQNENHWQFANSLSAAQIASPSRRKMLRNRCRYEVDNNTYADGIVETLAKDTIGTGPRLQVKLESSDDSQLIEQEFHKWMRESGFAEKLRIMRRARAVDGEAFAVFIDNPKLSQVKLDLKLIEAEQVTDPRDWFSVANLADGINFDDLGNPVSYSILKNHPSEATMMNQLAPKDVDASQVLHVFIRRRPGQVRGVPEIAPALPLFAQLRRFTLATIAAAETAAAQGGVIYTDALPDEDGTDTAEPFDVVDYEHNGLMTLPAGWKITQMKAEHPTTMYEMFKHEILNEIARCVSMPFNIAAANSSSYNYSSGRLDHLPYYGSIDIDRSICWEVVSDRVFHAWFQEAVRIEGYLPEYLRALGVDIPHQWNWDARPTIDQLKEAQADLLLLQNNMLTLARYYAERGLDYEEELRQKGKERELLEELGLSLSDVASQPSQSQPDQSQQQDNADQQDGEDNADQEDATASLAGHELVCSERGGNNALELTAEVEIQCAESEDGTPKSATFDALAYTGQPMQQVWAKHPIIVDVAGISLKKQSRPALLEHDRRSIVGHTTKITKDGNSLRASGVISGKGPSAVEVISSAKDGFPWQVSIGATIRKIVELKDGRTAMVNGREVRGPMYIVRSSELKEVSFVALGADDDTSASIAASMEESDMGFEAWVESLGLVLADLSDDQKTKLQTAYDKLQNVKASDSDSDEDVEANDDEETDSVEASIAARRKVEAAEVVRINKIRRIAKDHDEICAKAINDGWDVDKTELAVLKAQLPKNERDAIRAGRVSGLPVIFPGSGQAELSNDVCAAALLLQSGVQEKFLGEHYGAKVMETALSSRTKVSLGSIAYDILAANGHHPRGGRLSDSSWRDVLRCEANLDIKAEGAATGISLSGILGDSARKFLLAAFTQVPQVLPRITAARDLRDFKTHTWYRMTGVGVFQKVGPEGELRASSFGEESYTGKLHTAGTMVTLTRQDMVNDDLGAFSDMMGRIGRGAAHYMEEAGFTLLLDNSDNFFATGNKNYVSGAANALAIDGLTAVEQKFLDQTGDNGKPLMVMPRILLVPTSLKVTADVLMRESTIIASGVPTSSRKVEPAANPHAGKFEVIATPWLNSQSLTNASGTGYYLLADPMDMPIMISGFLNGNRTPVVSDGVPQVSKLAIDFPAYFDFGVSKAECRGGVWADGTD